MGKSKEKYAGDPDRIKPHNKWSNKGKRKGGKYDIENDDVETDQLSDEEEITPAIIVKEAEVTILQGEREVAAVTNAAESFVAQNHDVIAPEAKGDLDTNQQKAKAALAYLNNGVNEVVKNINTVEEFPQENKEVKLLLRAAEEGYRQGKKELDGGYVKVYTNKDERKRFCEMGKGENVHLENTKFEYITQLEEIERIEDDQEKAREKGRITAYLEAIDKKTGCFAYYKEKEMGAPNEKHIKPKENEEPLDKQASEKPQFMNVELVVGQQYECIKNDQKLMLKLKQLEAIGVAIFTVERVNDRIPGHDDLLEIRADLKKPDSLINASTTNFKKIEADVPGAAKEKIEEYENKVKSCQTIEALCKILQEIGQVESASAKGTFFAVEAIISGIQEVDKWANNLEDPSSFDALFGKGAFEDSLRQNGVTSNYGIREKALDLIKKKFLEEKSATNQDATEGQMEKLHEEKAVEAVEEGEKPTYPESQPVPGEKEIKLENVDINSKTIEEALEKNPQIIQELKKLLQGNNNQGKEFLQTKLIEVLNEHFDKFQLSEEAKEKLKQSIENLAAKIVDDIENALRESLEYKAAEEIGFIKKLASRFSKKTKLQVALTVAVGIGVGAAMMLCLPGTMAAVAAGGSVSVAGARGAASGLFRGGIAVLFRLGRKKSKEKAAEEDIITKEENELKEKEQKNINAKKQEILEQGVTIKVKTETGKTQKEKRDFIEAKKLSGLIANSLKVNTSEVFRSNIVNNEGKLVNDAQKIMYENIKTHVETDFKYDELNEEEKAQKTKELFSLYVPELLMQQEHLIDLDQTKGLDKAARLQQILGGDLSALKKEKKDTGGELAAHMAGSTAIGAGIGMAYGGSKWARAGAMLTLAGVGTYAALGEWEKKAVIGKFYESVENLMEAGEQQIQQILTNDFANLNIDALKQNMAEVQARLSVKKDNKRYALEDPVLRANAENFVHRANQLIAEKEKNNLKNPEFEEAMKNLGGKLDEEANKIIEKINKQVKDTQQKRKLQRILISGAVGLGAAVVGYFDLTGKAFRALRGIGSEEGVTQAKNKFAEFDYKKIKILNNQAELNKELKSLGYQANKSVTHELLDKIEKNKNSAKLIDKLVSNKKVESFTHGNHKVYYPTDTHFEDKISGKGDSAWRSARDILLNQMKDKSELLKKLGFKGDISDKKALYGWAEAKVAESFKVSGELPTLVHEGDTVTLHIDDQGQIKVDLLEDSGQKSGMLPVAEKEMKTGEVLEKKDTTKNLDNEDKKSDNIKVDEEIEEAKKTLAEKNYQYNLTELTPADKQKVAKEIITLVAEHPDFYANNESGIMNTAIDIYKDLFQGQFEKRALFGFDRVGTGANPEVLNGATVNFCRTLGLDKHSNTFVELLKQNNHNGPKLDADVFKQFFTEKKEFSLVKFMDAIKEFSKSINSKTVDLKQSWTAAELTINGQKGDYLLHITDSNNLAYKKIGSNVTENVTIDYFRNIILQKDQSLVEHR